MFGGINKTLVTQFRMPGYPLVLVTTEVLQEGEDLHTFCSRVFHYGITWTPSAMEQRTGRIDRIGSRTQRRLDGIADTPPASDLLQVYYPYLGETIEVLQVRRVFERLNTFLRLTHRLQPPSAEASRIDIDASYGRAATDVPQIKERLETAFPLRAEHFEGTAELVDAPDAAVKDAIAHLGDVVTRLQDDFEIPAPWVLEANGAQVRGEIRVRDEEVSSVCKFEMSLRACAAGEDAARLLLHAMGTLHPCDVTDELAIHLARAARASRIKLAVVPHGLREVRVRAEGDVLFARAVTEAEEVEHLIQRVTRADRWLAVTIDDPTTAPPTAGRTRDASTEDIARLMGGGVMVVRGGITLTYEAPDLLVRFPNERQQRIRCHERGGDLILSTTVATAAFAGKLGEARLAREILHRNGHAQVAAFGLTDSGRLEGWISHPLATMSRAEFRFYARQLAREADRWEYLLSTRDIH